MPRKRLILSVSVRRSLANSNFSTTFITFNFSKLFVFHKSSFRIAFGLQRELKYMPWVSQAFIRNFEKKKTLATTVYFNYTFTQRKYMRWKTNSSLIVIVVKPLVESFYLFWIFWVNSFFARLEKTVRMTFYDAHTHINFHSDTTKLVLCV